MSLTLPEINQLKLRYLRTSLFAGIGIAGAKLFAYYLTDSAAILTDAVEGGVNVLAAGFALYAVWLSAQPPDKEHPYGHGKIEFFSAGFEGGFIFMAGIGILYEAIMALIHQKAPEQLGIGIWLVAGGMVANGLLGWRLVRAGKKYHSLALSADGHHLLSDTYSSIGLVVGLILMHFTGWYWLDGTIAIAMAGMILYQGSKLIGQSVSGLMDKTDEELTLQVVSTLEAQRRDTWVDFHNLRVQRYGGDLHVDAHLTLPWYMSLERTHDELKLVEELLGDHFQRRVEVFVHPDPCLPTSCPICPLDSCAVRQAPFQQKLNWTIARAAENRKHTLP